MAKLGLWQPAPIMGFSKAEKCLGPHEESLGPYTGCWFGPRIERCFMLQKEVVSLFLNLRVHAQEAGLLLGGRAGKVHVKLQVLVTEYVLATPCPTINYLQWR